VNSELIGMYWETASSSRTCSAITPGCTGTWSSGLSQTIDNQVAT